MQVASAELLGALSALHRVRQEQVFSFVGSGCA